MIRQGLRLTAMVGMLVMVVRVTEIETVSVLKSVIPRVVVTNSSKLKKLAAEFIAQLLKERG